LKEDKHLAAFSQATTDSTSVHSCSLFTHDLLCSTHAELCLL